MKVILATHNYYLEYGLRLLLKEYRVILAADFSGRKTEGMF